MAKVSGPLFSVEAAGAYAGVIVFSKWKGRPVARKLVTPANPRSIGQETARNHMRVSGAVQKHINASTQIHAELAVRDKSSIAAVTPGGYAWNGYTVDSLIGPGHVNIDAADLVWSGLNGTEQAAWDTAAAGLTAQLPSVAQTVAGGAAGTPKSAGNVFLNLEYALYTMGLVNVPTAVPPVYV